MTDAILGYRLGHSVQPRRLTDGAICVGRSSGDWPEVGASIGSKSRPMVGRSSGDWLRGRQVGASYGSEPRPRVGRSSAVWPRGKVPVLARNQSLWFYVVRLEVTSSTIALLREFHWFLP